MIIADFASAARSHSHSPSSSLSLLSFLLLSCCLRVSVGDVWGGWRSSGSPTSEFVAIWVQGWKKFDGEMYGEKEKERRGRRKEQREEEGERPASPSAAAMAGSDRDGDAAAAAIDDGIGGWSAECAIAWGWLWW